MPLHVTFAGAADKLGDNIQLIRIFIVKKKFAYLSFGCFHTFQKPFICLFKFCSHSDKFILYNV